jgi:hypothetical protein
MEVEKLGFSRITLTSKKIVPDNFLEFIEPKITELLVGKVSQEISKGWSVLIQIVPNDNANEVEFLGPSRNRHEKYIVYALHLPAKSIAKSDNPTEVFLKAFFEVLIPFIQEKFSVSEEELKQLQKETEEKFLNDTIGWRIE